MKTRNMRDLQKHWAEQARKAAKKTTAQPPANAEEAKPTAAETEKPAKEEVARKRKSSVKAK